MNAILTRILSQLLGAKVGSEYVSALSLLVRGNVAGFYSALPAQAQADLLTFFLSKIVK